MSIREALHQAEERLERAEIADAKNDAWLLLQHLTGLTRTEYFLSPGDEFPRDKQEMFFRLVEERAAHRPLQHINGTQDFMGLTFHVNEHALIPRQDTEILVEKAIGILEEKFSGEEINTAGHFGKERSGKAERKEPEFSDSGVQAADLRPRGSRADRKEYRILDLCTGSGCIAVSLAAWALRNSWPVEITATDISEEALRVAEENAERILKKEMCGNTEICDVKAEKDEKAGADGALKQQIRFCLGDLFEAAERERFSMILSNPPYIPTAEIETLMPEVRDFEPRLALDGAEDGLALYRRIATEAPAHLEQGGMLLLEIGCDEACAVSELLAENGFCDILVLKDYAGLDRVVYGKYERI